MVAALITAVIQVLVLTSIPFLVYLATHRRARGFFGYVGLYRPERRTMLWATAAALVGLAAMLTMLSRPGLRELMTDPTVSVSGRLRAMGPSAESVFLLLLTAWVQTSLWEEVLFRGFLGRRLTARLGFGWGNALQAVIFGGLHAALFLGLAGAALTPWSAVAVVAAPTLFGWVLGYLKERAGNGSIVPGWWAHGLGNTLAFWIVGFLW